LSSFALGAALLAAARMAPAAHGQRPHWPDGSWAYWLTNSVANTNRVPSRAPERVADPRANWYAAWTNKTALTTAGQDWWNNYSGRSSALAVGATQSGKQDGHNDHDVGRAHTTVRAVAQRRCD
jgi:hypothetical protein